jgi:uncharacterized protein (DUF488 family)
VSRTIYTIGHSTRSLDELVTLLDENGVERLVDVRRYPGSRRYPHFSRESLSASLPANGIAYEHEPDLGGRRDGAAGSLNGGWRNAGFRAYADYMMTAAFRDALDRVLEVEIATALLCAEAVPWRCHRNLIADVLVARGVHVTHLLGPGSTSQHVLNAMARLRRDGSIVYPEPGAGQIDLLE